MKRPLLIILFFFCISLIVQGQKINEKFQMRIQKTTSKVVIDGVLNEQSWFDAAAVSDFVMCNPFDSLCAQVRTDVKMSYDDKYIYISAECFLKEPGAFVVESMKRDFAFGVNDNFLVFIDTFEDKTTGFEIYF